MATVNGNIIHRIGSQDYRDIQLMREDGVTPINLTSVINAVLKMQNLDGAIKTFDTSDINPKLFFDDDRATGKLQLRQSESDFIVVTIWKYYVELWDDDGMHPVPEGKEYSFTVRHEIPG